MSVNLQHQEINILVYMIVLAVGSDFLMLDPNPDYDV